MSDKAETMKRVAILTVFLCGQASAQTSAGGSQQGAWIPANQQTLSITILADGARRVRSTWGAGGWDDTCRLSEDRMTLTCEGIYSR